MSVVVESPNDVAKFLQLQTLSIEELKLQCNNSEKEESSKAALIKMIMAGNKEPVKSQGLLPQGIPLRSKNGQGKHIPGTSKNYKKWREIIFQAQDNLKEFQFVNKEGKQYSSKVWYIKCSPDTANHILENNWYSVYESQKDLITKIKLNSEQFDFHIIQKNAGNGNNFLMLHCQVKED